MEVGGQLYARNLLNRRLSGFQTGPDTIMKLKILV
jgi:hypothetical protein